MAAGAVAQVSSIYADYYGLSAAIQKNEMDEKKNEEYILFYSGFIWNF